MGTGPGTGQRASLTLKSSSTDIPHLGEVQVGVDARSVKSGLDPLDRGDVTDAFSEMMARQFAAGGYRKFDGPGAR